MPKNRLAYTPSEVAGITPATFSGYVYNPTTEFKHQDYDLLSRTVETREARIDKAIERKSAIDEALGKLESQFHNDKATREWFQSYKNKIQQEIADEIDAGNYRSAIRLATNKASEMLLDPEVQGRMQTNQQYQRIREEQRKLAGNNQELFNYWLAKNPYTHKNITDAEGKVIGNEDYTPNFTLVGEPNIPELAATAFKLITPTLEEFISTDKSTTTTKKYVLEETIKDNLSAILASSGITTEQIQQKWEYDKYLYEQEKSKLEALTAQLKELDDGLFDDPNLISTDDYRKLTTEKANLEASIRHRRKYLMRNESIVDSETYISNILEPIISSMAYDYTSTTHKTITSDPHNTNTKDADQRLGFDPNAPENVPAEQIKMSSNSSTNSAPDGKTTIERYYK
jgi:hypothetical protein